MKMNRTRRQVIRETDYGCYVWETPDGEILGDGDHYMLVFGTYNDKAAVEAIKSAAKHYGFPEGRAVFWPDVRPVSDEERANQEARMEAGLTPDIFDISAIKEEMEAIERGNNSHS